MMKISGVTENGSRQAQPLGGAVQNDSYSKSLKDQIANAKEQLQKLSENEDMTVEAKMEKRQEIQKQITSLEQQLRQHQIERQQKQRSGGDDMEEMLGAGPGKAEQKGSGMSKTSMQAIISADVSMKQARVQGSVATRLEGRGRILEGEISQDKARGINVEKKEEELAKVKQRTQEAAAAQASILASAGREIGEAARAEAEKGPGEAVRAEAEEGSGETSEAKESPDKAETGNRETEGAKKAENRQGVLKEPSWTEGYMPVDIRL